MPRPFFFADERKSCAIPRTVLFAGEKPFPVLPAVDHYAGSEKLMRKALQLQQELGPIFDITCDCEDGAHAGAEREHAEMVASVIMSEDNLFDRVGARIHDVTHPHWRQEWKSWCAAPAAACPSSPCPSRAAPATCRCRSRRCVKSSAIAASTAGSRCTC